MVTPIKGDLFSRKLWRVGNWSELGWTAIPSGKRNSYNWPGHGIDSLYGAIHHAMDEVGGRAEARLEPGFEGHSWNLPSIV
jgi:hypothetical protein